jgi:hypothetical protein
MRILLSNLVIVLAIYFFYCWLIPEFIPSYRSYVPFLAGVLVSWLVSALGISRVRSDANHVLSIAIAGGALCALLVGGASLVTIIATRGG